MDANGEDKADFTCREYQAELLDMAIKENLILYLPTGAGKTFIATMLIKEFSKEPRTLEIKYTEGGKRSFFLTNTVALVAQQALAIGRHTHFIIGEYCGDMGVDFWTHDQWLKQFDDHQVLVMTCQIFLDLLLHNKLKLQQVNVVVFDECHHAVNNQPMRQIMQQFQFCEKENQPRVLGLTATLINATCKADTLDREIKDLETTFLSKVATSVNREMVRAHSTNPTEETLEYAENNQLGSLSYSLCCTQLQGMQDFIMKVKFDEKSIKDIVRTSPDKDSELLSDKFKKINKKIKNLLGDVKYQLDELGLYGGSLAALAHLIQVEKIKLSCETDEILNVFTAVSTCLLAIRNIVHLEIDTELEENQIIKYSSPKVQVLLSILRKTKENDSTIVFVTRRFTAKVLFYLLKDLSERNPDYRHIKPNFVVGYNINPYNDTREGAFSRYMNRTVLKDFSENEINTLIASDVIEEGIDIRSCNYVIMFDKPKNFRSYVQSKGRARDRESRYILMIPRYDKMRFSGEYRGYKLLEVKLKQLLSGVGAINRQCPDDEEINNKLFGMHIPPYLPLGPEGPRVTENSAITLINRYCTSLVRDKFTKVAINWWVKKNTKTNKVKCYLQLPSDCPLRDFIEGPEQKNVVLAKRAVALEACKRLYELGEFDSELLPVGRTSLLASYLNLLPNWKDETDTVGENEQNLKSKTGLKDNKRLCFKQFPECLSNCQPEPNKTVYLHLIKFMPVYQEPTNDRLNVFYHLLKSDYEFGILSTKPLPQVCEFPIFMNVGELLITVESNVTTLQLSEEDIQCIVNLHSLLFLHVLQLVKSFMMRDTESKENSYLIVPVKPGTVTRVEIEWDIVRNIKSIPKVKEPSKEVRKQLVVNDRTHLGSVISPWYRSLLPQQNYVVTKVCTDMTEKSQFPSEEFQSYEDYFRNKYNLEVFCKDQPLIEVKAISSKINCIRPRGLSKQSGRRRKLDEEGFDETLIPEFCVKFDFPAVYWLKATALPSILHRIHHLMIAEEFRMQVVTEVKLGRLLKAGEKWAPLLVDPVCDPAKVQLPSGTPTLVSRPVHRRPQVDQDCVWGDEPLPVDLERCLNANLLEIKEYSVFVNKPVSSSKTEMPHLQNAQKRKPVILKQMVDPPSLNILSVVSDLGPQQYEIMQALTAQNAADVVNFERLETLGDSFLKFAVSLSLFLKYPDMTEGQLTSIKGKVVGNRNLYYCGNKINLGCRLKVHEFSATEDWIPPGFCIPHTLQATIRSAKLSPTVLFNLKLTDTEQMEGKINESTLASFQEKLLESIEEEDITVSANAYLVSQQVVADKTVADAVEAIIGVYIKNCGVTAGIRLLSWLGVMEEDVLTEQVLTAPSPDPRVSQNGSGTHHLVAPSELEAILNYKFRNRCYLLQALTHSTYSVNTVTRSYQRLEFLGDAIIDFLVTAHIYEKCGDSLTPGDLTDLRSALVNNITLASIVARYGIHKFLLLRSAKLNELITKFLIQQENHNFAVGDDVLLLIEERECNAAENVDVPKVLGDVFESIVGAIYLDCGKNLNTVWKVVYNLMREEIELYSKKVPKNAVRMLYEENVNASFESAVVTDEGLVMVPLSLVHGRQYHTFYGFGDKKSQAKVAAAKMALRYINGVK